MTGEAALNSRAETLGTVAVVVLAYGGGQECVPLVSGLAASGRIASERITVVHNPSRPGETLGLDVGLPVNVIDSATNVGYTGGMNLGIEWSRTLGASAVLLLTHEVRIDVETIEILCAALDRHPEYGAVAPVLFTRDGRPYSLGHQKLGRASFVHRTAVDSDLGDEPLPAASLDGSVMLWRSEALYALGGFDSRFFMYYEDIDICARAHREGWSTGVILGTQAATSPGGSRRPAAHAYLRTRNGLEYARKAGGLTFAFALWGLLRDLWNHSPKPGGTRFRDPDARAAARAYRRGFRWGIVDFVRRRWGPPPAALLRQTDIWVTSAASGNVRPVDHLP